MGHVQEPRSTVELTQGIAKIANIAKIEDLEIRRRGSYQLSAISNRQFNFDNFDNFGNLGDFGNRMEARR